MNSDYLAFLPLLLYGIALADLLSQWKRLFEIKKWFLPYLLFTMMLTETALYNVFIYEDLLHELEHLTYLNYLRYLIPPFLFLLTTNIFTPEDGADTKEYFLKQMPSFLTLFSLFVASHFLFNFDENLAVKVIRIVAIFLIFIIGLSRKTWAMYIIFLLWLIALLVKGNVFLTF